MTEQRKLAAIMFTDIVGYTALMSIDEHKALEVLRKNRNLIKPLVAEHNGEWLKEMGDGTLSCFTSSVDAVNCAIEIQKELLDDDELTIRIGLHTGDVVIDQGDIFGDGVNIASRIEPITIPGGICLSEQLYDSIRNKPDISAIYLGEIDLKNVGRPIRIYALTVAGLPVTTKESFGTRDQPSLPETAPNSEPVPQAPQSNF
ncbi:MAG: adenylate/guanylate cyclase domain-containing protein, partial [Psychrosphaera sp.]|nr:adenylate/guanylate cyclase domain-containing protein [Psychrosphaera sp.]